jgi:hypothetical protein
MDPLPKGNQTMRIQDTTIYLGDNGRAYCGAHLGYTAKMTGRDLSGQKIYAIQPEDIAEIERDGVTIRCERCGREPSRLVAV